MVNDEPSTASDVSPSLIIEVKGNAGDDEVDLENTATSESPEETPAMVPVPSNLTEVSGVVTAKESPEWVEWRENSDVEPANPTIAPVASSEDQVAKVTENKADGAPSAAGKPSTVAENDASPVPPQPSESEGKNHSSTETISNHPQTETESSAVAVDVKK